MAIIQNFSITAFTSQMFIFANMNFPETGKVKEG